MESINKNLIFVNLNVSTQNEVFEILGGKLTELGYCREDYTNALKEREQEFPTGVMVQDIGVAIPHTDPEYIKQPAIAIATLKQPITFFHMGTNPKEKVAVPVKFIIMLAIGGECHLDMLQKAIRLIQVPKRLTALIEAKDTMEIIRIIREEEEKCEEI